MCVCFSLPVFSEGIYWMNIVSVKHIYCCSNRVIEVFSLNHLCDFWAFSRCSVTSLSLVTCRGKSTRVMAIGNDSRFVNYYFFLSFIWNHRKIVCFFIIIKLIIFSKVVFGKVSTYGQSPNSTKFCIIYKKKPCFALIRS